MLNCASFLTLFAVATADFANFDLGHKYEARTRITKDSAALGVNKEKQRERDFYKARQGKCVMISCCYIYQNHFNCTISCLYNKKS